MAKFIVYSEEEVLQIYTCEVEADTKEEAVDIAREQGEREKSDEELIEIKMQYADKA